MNNTIRFKVCPGGYKKLADSYNEQFGWIENIPKKTEIDYKNIEDSEGYIEMPMNEFITTIGRALEYGVFNQPIEMDILIKENHLSQK